MILHFIMYLQYYRKWVNLMKHRFVRKGSAEIVALVILVVLGSIVALTVSKSTANTTLSANQKAQEAISFMQ